MINVLFSGCSFVAGTGLDNEHNNPGHYTHLFCDKVFGKTNYLINNIGIPGNSNERIFLDTTTQLLHNRYDYVFVNWTSLHRYVFWLGLELYNCRRCFTPSGTFTPFVIEHKGNNSLWSSKDLNKLSQQFLLLNHEHYYICDIVNYVNILIKLAETAGTKIYFINNLISWDKDYFNYIPGIVTPSILTNFTNTLLNSDNRADEEINQLYHLIHTHYKNLGTIRENHWLNLYKSFNTISIDTGNDNMHPGLESQKVFADLLASAFKK